MLPGASGVPALAAPCAGKLPPSKIVTKVISLRKAVALDLLGTLYSEYKMFIVPDSILSVLCMLIHLIFPTAL